MRTKLILHVVDEREADDRIITRGGLHQAYLGKIILADINNIRTNNMIIRLVQTSAS